LKITEFQRTKCTNNKNNQNHNIIFKVGYVQQKKQLYNCCKIL